MKVVTVTSALILSIASFSLHAEIYKWVDDKGNVHYSDQPARQSKQLNISEESEQSDTVSKEDREERRKRLLQAFDEDRELKKEQQQKEQKQKARQDRNCAVAKDRLRRYTNASSLYDLDKDGNRVHLSNEERERSIERLRSQINKYCN